MGTMDELVDGDVVEQLRRTFQAHAGSTRPDWPGLHAAASAVAGRPLRRRVDLVRDALVSDVGSGFDLLSGVVDASLAEPGFRGWAGL